MKETKALGSQTRWGDMRKTLTILTASFILLASSFTFNSCKACDKDEKEPKPTDRDNKTSTEGDNKTTSGDDNKTPSGQTTQDPIVPAPFPSPAPTHIQDQKMNERELAVKEMKRQMTIIYDSLKLAETTIDAVNVLIPTMRKFSDVETIWSRLHQPPSPDMEETHKIMEDIRAKALVARVAAGGDESLNMEVDDMLTRAEACWWLLLNVMMELTNHVATAYASRAHVDENTLMMQRPCIVVGNTLVMNVELDNQRKIVVMDYAYVALAFARVAILATEAKKLGIMNDNIIKSRHALIQAECASSSC
jgi:hypothetical protein